MRLIDYEVLLALIMVAASGPVIFCLACESWKRKQREKRDIELMARQQRALADYCARCMAYEMQQTAKQQEEWTR